MQWREVKHTFSQAMKEFSSEQGMWWEADITAKFEILSADYVLILDIPTFLSEDNKPLLHFGIH